MKHKGLLILIPILLLSSCGEASSTISPITITSLKDGLLQLSSLQNYQIDYIDNEKTIFSYVFTSNSIGIDSSNKNYIDTLIEDEQGIYNLKYYNRYRPGEYKLDSNNNKIKDLWSSDLVHTLYGKEVDYINSLDENATSVKISNKKYKMALIQTLGYESDDYVELESVNATYNENKLYFDIKFNNNPTYTFVAHSFNQATNQSVNDFISQGGKAFVANEDLSAMRRLMCASNFTRDIYDFSTSSYTGVELFNPNYFYYETTGATFGQGCLEMNQKANENHNVDLYGCYPFVLTGNLKHGFTDASFYNTPQYSKPIIEELYHYPVYMNLWTNLQFIDEGKVEGSQYDFDGSSYHISNLNFIYDFAINFSINQSFPFNEFVPFGLGIDINYYDEQDEYSEITFTYCFKYENKIYEMPIPIRDFGVSNIEMLDNIYKEYNN